MEINGCVRATVTRTFWRRSRRDGFARALTLCGWSLELAGDRAVPFTRGHLWRYTVTLLAPSTEARRQAQALAVQQLAHPDVTFVVVPTFTPPPRPTFREDPA